MCPEWIFFVTVKTRINIIINFMTSFTNSTFYLVNKTEVDSRQSNKGAQNKGLAHYFGKNKEPK